MKKFIFKIFYLSFLISFLNPIGFAKNGLKVEIERISTYNFPELSVYITVLDEKNEPVENLYLNNFALFEGKRKEEIKEVTPLNKIQPSKITLLIMGNKNDFEERKIKEISSKIFNFLKELKPTSSIALIDYSQIQSLEEEMVIKKIENNLIFDQEESFLKAVNAWKLSENMEIFHTLFPEIPNLLKINAERKAIVISSYRPPFQKLILSFNRLLTHKYKIVYTTHDPSFSGEDREIKVLVNLGRSFGETKAIYETKDLLEKARGLYFKADAHYQLGLDYSRQGLIEAAVDEFKKAIEINPNHSEAHYQMGIIYATQGMLDDAIDEFKIALKIAPNNDKAHFQLGILYAQRGMIGEAIAEIERSLKLNPHNPEANYQLGLLYREKGMLDEAMEKWEQVLKYEPEREDVKELIKHSEQEKLWGKAAYAVYLVGEKLFHQGKYKEAIVQFQKASELNPNYIAAIHSLALAYYHSGELSLAIEVGKKIIEKEPNNKAVNYLIRKAKGGIKLGKDYFEFYERGYIYYSENNFVSAVEEYKKAIKIGPQKPFAYYWLGRTYYKMGKFTEAIKMFQKVHEIGSELKNEAKYLIKKSDGAKEWGREAFENYEQGWLLYSKGRFQEASDIFQKAINLNAKFKQAKYWLNKTKMRLK